MALMSAEQERLALSRLFHRFGFGPKPGEFERAVKSGFEVTKKNFLTKPSIEQLGMDLAPITVDNLGPRPTPGTFANTEYQIKQRSQIKEMTLWWLDQMVTTDYSLNEKMTWFWHGHWATSIEKLNYALPMYKQNLTFRNNALGNFATMSKAMYDDGALQYWLDGQENTAKAPNENLSREFMELFTLGVGRYTEDDVKALARVFTGIQVQRTNGVVAFNPRRHDSSAVTLLGTTQVFTEDQAIDLLVARDDSSRFIYERLWYRFISSTETFPVNYKRDAFANRDIHSAVSDLVSSPHMYSPQLAMVKSPIEWFVALCRALKITPSAMKNVNALTGGLQKLSQVPFAPPNVGGWPAGELWLTSASAQFRLTLAQAVLKNTDLAELKAVTPGQRVKYLQDLLGVYQWSKRTSDALTIARNEPERLFLLAINSPEYVVGA
jgi:uncharacterized protein (DUF1800 family)